MSSQLRIDQISDLVPLENTFGATDIVPELLEEPVLGGDIALFAVLDGAKVPGIVEMCMAENLRHQCLYIGEAFEEHADVAPWLVELTPQAKLLRNMMTRGEAAWHLWDRQAGILIRSPQSFDALWAHLRKFTLLPDEEGNRFFFRFFEPDFLSAVLQQAEPGEVAHFFAAIDRIVTVEQLRPEVWTASVLSVDPEPEIDPAPFVLTRRKWQAMQHVEFTRTACRLCVEYDIAASDHEEFVKTAVWLQRYGYSHDTNLVDAFVVLQQIGPDHQGPIWRTISEGDYSMGFILHETRRRFGLERVSA